MKGEILSIDTVKELEQLKKENKILKATMKPLFPEDVEMICISKNDYDRLYGDLTYENIELQDRINKAIEYIETLEKQEAYKIEDNENGVPELKVDNEEYFVFCKYNKLLNILKGDNK